MVFAVGLVDPGGPIGSTNGVMSSSVIFNDKSNDKNDNDINVITKGIEDFRSGSYRQDTISDINWGMTVIANSIKVISAIFTIISTDNKDR